ncbi:MAG: dicarboxylate/amino acid:cation symporter [Bacteroidetes bacterium]|nr:dicarboxylate/amino acid:cation symporter [Bacteroidota bacterium]
MLKNTPLFAKILAGMVLGVVWGFIAILAGFNEMTLNWISPWGVIFLNLLKLIAVPLIFVSLVKGVSSLTDITRLSRIGFKTIGLYLLSTVLAISVGLILVNFIQPGKTFPEEIRNDLMVRYEGNVEEKLETAIEQKDKGPLQFVIDLVPENIVNAATDNRNMLQVIFFALLFGIAIVLLPRERTRPVRDFFEGLNDVVLKIIDLIMKFAPFGVFALMAALMVEIAGDDIGKTADIFTGLGMYALTVIAGLGLLILFMYPLFLRIFAKISYLRFVKGVFPAQMVAFSTSSSAATLPVTMECCEKNLGVSKDVSSFVLPIGATVNMDGTSLYQAVAAVFIAQAFGFDLTLTQQLTIVLTATLASIGAAAVPSAGIIMLIIVLESIGVPSAGIALILAIDRPLDMLRTVVNITGDSTVATIVNGTEKTVDSHTENGISTRADGNLPIFES